MSAVTVDIRLLKKGLKWCATSHVTAPNLRAPVSLYTCEDVRGALSMLQKALGTVDMPKEFLAKASSNARKKVRREILGLTYNLLTDLSQDLATSASKMQRTLEAGDKACDLVHESRDDGRAGFRVTMVAPASNEKRPFKRERLALPLPKVSTGAEKQLALYYPGTTVPNVKQPDISKKDLELMLHDPFEYVPYPASSSDRYSIQSVLKPAIAAF